MYLTEEILPKLEQRLRLQLKACKPDQILNVMLVVSPNAVKDTVPFPSKDKFSCVENWRKAYLTYVHQMFALVMGQTMSMLKDDGVKPQMGSAENTILISGTGRQIDYALQIPSVVHACLASNAKKLSRQGKTTGADYLVFSKRELEILETIAGHAGISQENALVKAVDHLIRCEQQRKIGLPLIIYTPKDQVTVKIVHKPNADGLYGFESEKGCDCDDDEDVEYYILKFAFGPGITGIPKQLEPSLGCDTLQRLAVRAIHRYFRFFSEVQLGRKLGTLPADAA